MHNVYLRTVIFSFSLSLLAIPASAQNERVRLSAGAAATTGGGDNMAWTTAIGYRFLERLSFEVDLTAGDSPRGNLVRSLVAAPTQGPMDRMQRQIFDRAAIFQPTRAAGNDGNLAVVTAGFRYELPVQGGRLRSYLGAGLGIARSNAQPGIALALVRNVINVPDRGNESVTRTGIAASAGMGASLRVFRGLFADIDVRYFRLDGDRDMTRLGGGLSYRF